MNYTYSSYDKLILDGILYYRESLLDKVSENLPEAWERDVFYFIKEWLNDKEYVVVHTSGSTGQPKEIKIMKQNMVHSAQATGAYFRLQEGHSALLCLSANYIAGKMMIVRAFVLGLNLIVFPTETKAFSKINQKIDFAAMVPLQVERLIERYPEKVSHFKKIIIGGAPVLSKLEDALQMIPCQCYATYGMTETITHVAIQTINGTEKSSVFKALPDVRFSTNQQECLMVEAPRVASGKIITNDVVELISPYAFVWKGRFGHVINSGGIKIHPEKVERKMGKLIECRYMISSLPDELLGEKVILVLEQKPSQTLAKCLLEELSSILQKYEVPKEVYFLDDFEETPTQKIQRKKTCKKLIDSLKKEH